MRFLDKTVLVTGGAKGIGKAISIGFARSGAFVVIMDIDVEAGNRLVSQIISDGGRASFIHGDVSSEDDVFRVVTGTVEISGSIDVLINNAGIGWTGTLLERSTDDWRKVIEVNLTGPYLMAKYSSPYLATSKGSNIINIVSTRALMSERNSEPYSASKGGLLALTHSLAITLGPKVRVNAICPGWIDITDSQSDKPSKQSDVAHNQHPVGRVGRPEDVADACLFLSSDEASFITGANLIVDGGMTRKMIYLE
ncbi:MAG: glucose 1-dehydrogenase [Kosmotogaceae bacterium]|nr:glucose 1-dehydrogenase [Kosmotogaceae bacterium]